MYNIHSNVAYDKNRIILCIRFVRFLRPINNLIYLMYFIIQLARLILYVDLIQLCFQNNNITKST